MADLGGFSVPKTLVVCLGGAGGERKRNADGLGEVVFFFFFFRGCYFFGLGSVFFFFFFFFFRVLFFLIVVLGGIKIWDVFLVFFFKR